MTTSTYTGTTASTQVDPEAPHQGAASESSPALDEALCATAPDSLDWVPTRERAIVPEQMAALCRRCTGRQECLLWALATGDDGYWAATTTSDRLVMRLEGKGDLATADRLQRAAMSQLGEPQHPIGAGTTWYYARKCRCGECREANRVAKADERARARGRSSLTVVA